MLSSSVFKNVEVMKFEKSSYHSLIGMIVWIIITLIILKKKSLNFKCKSNLLENISRASAIFTFLHDVFLWEILPTSDFYESSFRCFFYSFGYFFFFFPFSTSFWNPKTYLLVLSFLLSMLRSEFSSGHGFSGHHFILSCSHLWNSSLTSERDARIQHNYLLILP